VPHNGDSAWPNLILFIAVCKTYTADATKLFVSDEWFNFKSNEVKVALL